MHWHTSPEAHALIASLTAADLKTRKKLGCPGPDYYVFVGRTEHGRNVMGALDDLSRADPIEAEFRSAKTAEERRAILDRARLIPSVQDMLADRFGEPDRIAA